MCHILGDIRPCRRLLLLAAHMIKTNAAKKTILGYLDIYFDRCLDISVLYRYPSLLEINLLTIAMIKTNAAKKTIFGFLSKDFTFEHLFAILNAGFISRCPLSCILEMTFLIYALRKCLCQI